MKKGLKIILIVIGVLIGIIVLDTIQAKIFNNSPLLKIRDNIDDETIDYIDKGLFVNHYYCTNKEEKTLFKGKKYNCPKTDNDTEEILETKKDDRGLYKLLNYGNGAIYSDEENPMFIIDNKKTFIKEFLPISNCTIDCIHNYSEPIATLRDGGTEIYSYEVLDKTYYLVKCNKTESTVKDILIGQNQEKLIKLC